MDVMKHLFLRFLSTQSTRGQAARYLVAGSSAVLLLDMVIYRLLIWLTGSTAFAKAVGYVAGTLYSFFINRSFTFKHGSSSKQQVLVYVVIYILSGFLNTGINQSGLALLGTGEIGINLSFTVAAVASAAFNFVCMKRFVFKPA